MECKQGTFVLLLFCENKGRGDDEATIKDPPHNPPTSAPTPNTNTHGRDAIIDGPTQKKSKLTSKVRKYRQKKEGKPWSSKSVGDLSWLKPPAVNWANKTKKTEGKCYASWLDLIRSSLPLQRSESGICAQMAFGLGDIRDIGAPMGPLPLLYPLPGKRKLWILSTKAEEGRRRLWWLDVCVLSTKGERDLIGGKSLGQHLVKKLVKARFWCPQKPGKRCG